jgi:hypothetical protein
MARENFTTVRDQLFLFAHKENGKPKVNGACLAYGLAAAALADLVLSEHLTTESPERLGLRNSKPHWDPVCAFVLETLGGNRDARDISKVLRWLATDITDRAGGFLFASGRVRRDEVNKWMRPNEVTYRPTRPDMLIQIRGSLVYAVNGSDYTGPQQLVLCGLVRILRLERELSINVGSSELLVRLAELQAHSPPAVRHILDTAEHLIGEVANAAVKI